jgi:hypothetical protein
LDSQLWEKVVFAFANDKLVQAMKFACPLCGKPPSG